MTPSSLQTLFLDGYPPFQVASPRGWQNDPKENPLSWDYAHSLAWICPICLKQWAVLHFEGDPETTPRAAYCAKCQPLPEIAQFRGRVCIPGSIFGSGTYNIDLPLLEVLPEPLLRREFELTLRQMEVE